MRRRRLSPRHGSSAGHDKPGEESSRRESSSSSLGDSTAFQLGILVMLMVQNASDPLLMQKANVVSGTGRDGAPARWNAQTGVMVNQLFKLAVSLPLALYSGESPAEIIGSWADGAGSALPSLLFLLQGNLQFAAIQHLDAATYAALSQLKILAAALFAVILLRRPLPWRRWLALAGLVAGLILVQHSSAEPARGAETAELELERSRALALGVGFSVACSCLSGLSGVYTESILKESKLSLWSRNVHFSLIGCVLSLAGFVATGDFRSLVIQGRFFDGYTPWCWACIINRSLGGLLVSMVTKYTSNLAKHLACAVSMVLTCVVAVVLGRPANWEFAMGIAIVCLSTTMYNVSMPKLPEVSTSRALSKSLVALGLASTLLVANRFQWFLRLGVPFVAEAASDQNIDCLVQPCSSQAGTI